MSVVANSLTLFVVDVSASMGRKREVEELVVTDTYTTEKRTRVTTNLEWVSHFVSTRIAQVILRNLKTTKVAVILYGSRTTNNNVVDAGVTDSYTGIDEVFCPAVPTVRTLDLVQNLRPTPESDNVAPGDPLSALVDAIQLSSLPAKGGIRDSQKRTWKRTIYLITDATAPFSYSGSETTKNKLLEEGIDFRLLGVDFDLLPANDSQKPSVKQRNQAFWHDFVGDQFMFATASQAIADTLLPTLEIKNPAPSKTLLCFGDPKDLAQQRAIQIPIALYKMIDAAKPMTRKLISKLAYEDAQAKQRAHTDDADDPDVILTTEVQRNRFLLDQLTSTQQNSTKQPQPLPQEAEANFTRAWKLGASLIPVPDAAFATRETHKSMEIVHFFSAPLYRREYNVEEIWYVFADSAQEKAQVQLASFVQAMHELDVLAVVRFVRKDGSEPELGILKPQIDPTTNYFYYSKAPFRQDLRRFLFPPLDRVITTEGVEVRQAPTIPDEADQNAMDAFVDSAQLDPSWFKVEESFNPAIHALKAAVRHRVIHPQDPRLPGPHPSPLKYVEAPHAVRVAAARAAEKCKQRFKIAYIPPKNNTEARKRNVASARADDPSRAPKQPRAELAAHTNTAPVKPDAHADAHDSDDDDDTQDENELHPPPQPLAPAAPVTDLLDTARPVAHFHQLVQDDDVTRAVIQLESTIRHFVQQREYESALSCMAAGKTVAQEYEEAMRWNIFIRSLKRTLLQLHRPFWESSVKGRYDLGLVTHDDDEARQSDLTHQDAQDFIETEEV